MSAVIPFQIVIGGRDAGGYGLRAMAAGRVAEARLALADLPADPESLGAALGAALFPVPVRQLLIDVAHGADEAAARVQIQLGVAAPELAALPWEWASLGAASPWRPALRDDYALMRVGRSPHSRPTLPVVGPVRLLIACAPGAAVAAAAPLGHALAVAVRAGDLVVDLLRDSDPAALREALAEEPCHVLHLVAADAIGTGSSTRLRMGRVIDAAGLAGLLADYGDLRLLSLAADLGAEAGALAEVAATLHERLGLATLALGDLDNGQVAAFCGPCYGAIAAGDPVDLAVTDGRAALAAAGEPWGAPRLWATPGAERLFAALPADAAPAPVRRRALEPTELDVGLSAPVGTPVRPRPAAAALSRSANQALSKARSFVVDVTTVGKPAQRPRSTATPSTWLQPRLIALIIACLVLALLVSQVLVLPGDAGAGAVPAAPTPSLNLLLTPAPTP